MREEGASQSRGARPRADGGREASGGRWRCIHVHYSSPPRWRPPRSPSPRDPSRQLPPRSAAPYRWRRTSPRRQPRPHTNLGARGTTGSFDTGRSPHESALTGLPCPRRTTEDIWIWAVPRPRSGHSALTSSLARCALPCALGLPCSCTRPPEPLAAERRAGVVRRLLLSAKAQTPRPRPRSCATDFRISDMLVHNVQGGVFVNNEKKFSRKTKRKTKKRGFVFLFVMNIWSRFSRIVSFFFSLQISRIYSQRLYF